MKRIQYYFIGLSVLSLIGIGSFFCLHKAAIAREMVTEHDDVAEPTQALMGEIEQRLGNMLGGILSGNLKYVANEAGFLMDRSYTINEIFFPSDPKTNEWFKRAGIDPEDSQKIIALKENFDMFRSGILYKASKVRQSALSGDQEATFKAFNNMIEETCFDCHRKYRDGGGLPPQPGFHGPGY
ncbi:MAG: cytochrome c [Candidatus Brocadiaceae bacterium]|nr:cytochrome c [Candidatus Brocadiaceae bacterium]